MKRILFYVSALLFLGYALFLIIILSDWASIGLFEYFKFLLPAALLVFGFFVAGYTRGAIVLFVAQCLVVYIGGKETYAMVNSSDGQAAFALFFIPPIQFLIAFLALAIAWSKD